MVNAIVLALFLIIIIILSKMSFDFYETKCSKRALSEELSARKELTLTLLFKVKVKLKTYWKISVWTRYLKNQ